MTDAPTPSEDKAAKTSLGDLIGEVARDFSTLLRQELELAKAELRQTVKRGGTGVGLYGGAVYAALMAVFFLTVALWWALGLLVGLGWSAVIIAVLWALIALIMFMVGRREFESVKGAPQTVDSLKKIPETLKRNEENQ